MFFILLLSISRKMFVLKTGKLGTAVSAKRAIGNTSIINVKLGFNSWLNDVLMVVVEGKG
jgi:hypothetical protein